MHTRYLLLAALISLPAYAQKDRPSLTADQVRISTENAARQSATPDRFWRAWTAAFGSHEDEHVTAEDLRKQNCERIKRHDRNARC